MIMNTRNHNDVLILYPEGKITLGDGDQELGEAVRTSLGIAASNRFSGTDRYGTSVAVGRRCFTEGWLDGDQLGFAAKLPDALAGGVACGRLRRPLLLTTTTTLPTVTSVFLRERRDRTNRIGFYGGAVSMSEALRTTTMRVLF